VLSDPYYKKSFSRESVRDTLAWAAFLRADLGLRPMWQGGGPASSAVSQRQDFTVIQQSHRVVPIFDHGTADSTDNNQQGWKQMPVFNHDPIPGLYGLVLGNRVTPY
jgi:hypothetical protein